MVVTNPWLAGPSPTKTLPREVLEERMLNLLSAQNMCVLATAGPETARRGSSGTHLEPRRGWRTRKRRVLSLCAEVFPDEPAPDRARLVLEDALDRAGEAAW